MGDFEQQIRSISSEITARNAQIRKEVYKLLYEEISSSQDFEIIEDLRNQTLFVEWPNGQRIDLKDYLPKGYRFKQSIQFGCDLLGRVISYDPNLLSHQATLLIAFHEMGHAQESLFYSAFQVLRVWTFSLLIYLRSFRAAHFLASIIKSDVKTARKCLAGQSIEFLTPPHLLDQKQSTYIKSERDASACALKKLRQLNDRGYNVFSGFSSLSEVRCYINAALMTYDLDYLDTKSSNIYLLLGNSEEQIIKHGQLIFSRKNNEFLKYLRTKKMV